MVTNDERRRVAAALRENTGKGVPLILNVAFAAFDVDPVSLERQVSSDEAALRLADLIDPDIKMAQDSPRRLEEVNASDGIVAQDDRGALQVTYSRSTGGPCGMTYMVKVRLRDKGLERDFYAVDREALLKLADEMDKCGRIQRERQKRGKRWFIDGLDIMAFARRIRDACGAEQ